MDITSKWNAKAHSWGAKAEAKIVFDVCRFYRPETKLWEGNVFTGVCQSFCSLGGSAIPCLRPDTPPRTRHPLWSRAPLGRNMGPDKKWHHTPWYDLVVATKTGGTHPTGMHSCLFIFFLLANEVCKGYVFTPVSQSFCSWGGLHPQGASRGVCIRESLHPGELRRFPPPLTSDSMGYDEQAGSTHPTGMHSCLLSCLLPLGVNGQ